MTPIPKKLLVGGYKKNFIAILDGLLLILMSVYATSGTNAFRAKNYTAACGVVTETDGTAIVTLTQPLWQGGTSTVLLAPDGSGDHPLATSYSQQNQNLTIIVLDDSLTRNITIPYSISNLTHYLAADPLPVLPR